MCYECALSLYRSAIPQLDGRSPRTRELSIALTPPPLSLSTGSLRHNSSKGLQLSGNTLFVLLISMSRQVKHQNEQPTKMTDLRLQIWSRLRASSCASQRAEVRPTRLSHRVWLASTVSKFRLYRPCRLPVSVWLPVRLPVWLPLRLPPLALSLCVRLCPASMAPHATKCWTHTPARVPLASVATTALLMWTSAQVSHVKTVEPVPTPSMVSLVRASWVSPTASARLTLTTALLSPALMVLRVPTPSTATRARAPQALLAPCATRTYSSAPPLRARMVARVRTA